MKTLAIIPARGGSKRIPQKNIKPFLDKPIIAYSIKAAINSKLFDEIMVSTDDKDVANIAQQYGASVPFFRSEKTSDDFATIADVIEEVVANYENQGKTFDLICCILPTAPFVNPQKLSESFALLKEKQYDSVIPVMRFSYPIQRALQIDENQHLSMIAPENLNRRSQDLQPAYHDCGQFYWVKTQAFLQEHFVFTQNGGAIVIPENEGQDIDTLEDWTLAELKYKLIHGI